MPAGRTLNTFRHKQLTAALRNSLSAAGARPDGVVIGASGILGAYGAKPIHDLDVWVPPQTFERLRKLRTAKSALTLSGTPSLQVKTPNGELEIFTGPWMTNGKDYGGPGNTVRRQGFQRWSLPKVLE